MEATRETWRPLPCAEGRYDVSDHGNVRSWLPARSGPLPRLMTPDVTESGHLQVCLTIDRHRQVRKVHQLVLLTFVGPRPPGLLTRHLDGNPANNHVSNLRYGTDAENMQDKIRHGNNQHLNKTHCPHNHPYDEENTIHRRGQRICRTCERDRSREYQRRRRAAERAAVDR